MSGDDRISDMRSFNRRRKAMLFLRFIFFKEELLNNFSQQKTGNSIKEFEENNYKSKIKQK